jgi:integrase/recombinase XerD
MTTTTTPTVLVEFKHPTVLDVRPEALDFDQLVPAWLASLRSANTRSGYLVDVRRFAEWCSEHGLALTEVRRHHLDLWVRVLEDRHRPATVVRKLAAVSSLFDYAESVGLMASNPALRVKRPRVAAEDQNVTPARTREELDALVRAARTPRDRALVEVLAVMGLRISEALALDLDALERDRGHLTFVIHGKGNRYTRAAVPPRVAAALEALAEHEHRTTGPVFATRGERWNRHQAGRAIKRLGRAAGLEGPLRPHQLRASAITLALELGDPLHRVQTFARHASPATTRRYDANREALDHSPAYTIASALVS